MSWDANVNSTPEKYGLTIIGAVEWSEPCYSFDTTLVFRDGSGRFYVASDSGCSCPMPFEFFEGIDACEGPFTAHEVHTALAQVLADNAYLSDGEKERAEAQIVDAMSRVMALPAVV